MGGSTVSWCSVGGLLWLGASNHAFVLCLLFAATDRRSATATSIARTLSPHKTQVHAQAAVNAGTVEADEDAIRHRGPSRVLGRAIEADLQSGEDRRHERL